MSRILLLGRLAARDLRRRPAEAALLLLAVTVATTTLTFGIILNGLTGQPYQSTRDATAGPDVVASIATMPDDAEAADPAVLTALADSSDVTAFSGPYPYTAAELTAPGVAATAWLQGRDSESATVDRPAVVDGAWTLDRTVVIEASFAEALGIGVGDRIELRGETFDVAGIAVTTSTPPYPKTCFAPCRFGEAEPSDEEGDDAGPPPEGVPPPGGPQGLAFGGGPGDEEAGPSTGSIRGLVWVGDADLRRLTTPGEGLGYVVHLKLADATTAPAFVSTHKADNAPGKPVMNSWQELLDYHSWMVETRRKVLVLGGWMLGVLALASIAVLVGGRMADQVRRVGLLKAVGGTPRLIAGVLLVEHAVVALAGATAGLTVGHLTAPLLADPGAALLGSVGVPPPRLATIGLVLGAALAIAGSATFVPAVRAARSSTVVALADSTRPPRRTAWLVGLAARLPAPLLLGLRIAARRPQRTLLGVAAVAVAITGIVAALAAYGRRYLEGQWTPGVDPRLALTGVLLLLAIVLIIQAVLNVVCIVWATVLDTRRASALARTLGATPGQVSAGIAVAQVIPALVGALLGLVGGIGLAEILDEDPVSVPPAWQLAVVVLGCAGVVAVVTAIPARIAARRPAGEALHTERA